MAELTEDEFQRLYGPLRPLRPREVAALFAGAPFRWWIVGGWSIEAFTGVARSHADVDVAVLVGDLPALREWLRDYHLWQPDQDGIRHLRPGAELHPGQEQVWLRRDAYSPWIADILLTPHDGDDWLCKRDTSIRLPLDRVSYVAADGVPYEQPELTLLFKAKHSRPKDEADFTAALPLLDDPSRDFLRASLELIHPGHPWTERL